MERGRGLRIRLVLEVGERGDREGFCRVGYRFFALLL